MPRPRKLASRIVRLLASALFHLGPAFAETTQIPSPNGSMVTEVYMPTGHGPFPVVIYAHGRGQRVRLNPNQVEFWTQRGIAVVAPERPGYGSTGGGDIEDPGSCLFGTHYARGAAEAARALLATVDWVRQQGWARSNRMLLVGTSGGGLATVATAAQNPAGVVGYVNISGGIGGDHSSPGRSCQPEALAELFGSFGRTTRAPGLWLYAENDLYWGAEEPKMWLKAFNSHGGHATLVFTGPSGADGHVMFYESPGLWQPRVAAFMRALGM